MPFRELPGGHGYLECDMPDCTMHVMGTATEAELVEFAVNERDWTVDDEIGIRICFIHRVHDCEVCGAMCQSGIRRQGAWHYYCDEHWNEGVHDG